MKTVFAICAVAALTLAGCGEKSTDETGATTPAKTAKASLDDRCAILASDPEAQENFDEMGTDADGFCDCMVKYVRAQSETDQQAINVALVRVTDGMQEMNTGAEEVVSQLMREIMLESAVNGEMTELGTGIQKIGMAIDEIGEGFEETGSCPIS
ncbi:hypothetical protein [Henriciella litoralis]|uniref:hypothetical protein n=1 Tax=Henriciella litoralis TaxID=568102 RepID=UPI0009FD12FC|nr:hypothetical protein [Henriciella litoralis]